MAATSLLILGAMASTALGETVLGSVVFSRHGDRSAKHYSGYQLTELGSQQCFQVGSSYRERYLSSDSPQRILGISEDSYVPSQIWASAPDQAVLLNTATAFLQGFYPPLAGLNPELASSTLNNGSFSQRPLDGYQYVTLHGEDDQSPDTIWIKGDDGCLAQNEASDSFKDSAEFQQRVESTRSFYAGFWDILDNVYDYEKANLTYAKAYDIFDLINVAGIHNASSVGNVTDEELFQLRTLADSHEFGLNFNASQPERSIGGQTLLGGIFSQLNQTVSSKGKLKFSLLAGSYDTFLQTFGLTNLIDGFSDFYGLPEYASTMAFELFTPEDSTSFPSDADAINVRFLFRNGTAGSLTQFPLFGRPDDSMTWSEFSSEMQKRTISSVSQWCQLCSSTESFCGSAATAAGTESVGSGSGSGMSNAVAGVIGAFVTLGVLLVVGGLVFVVFRRRGRGSTGSTGPTGPTGIAMEKSSQHSVSENQSV
ncbi:phosphoglycerate mutase-like protein [Eremomyces bilateralis CBS 781.70]|uniref:Phosphoglycerate mutase-like protein n=1 Tax=Eremomyces bilateralis CBS 781.70 TaxID=1392243 RepID=A0A6G1G109_9PEZI|nr:phosphoglycerate mutase-like protein [Eremomyces bilateralis CBS 781.70]KAF1811797.1 phosphoglycerate mutase-like protein [Eremomyces bilateralis CBS 781.70]